MIVSRQPRTSALARAVHGDEVGEWGLTEQLLAVAANELRWLHWTKTKNAGKASNPEPTRIGPSWWQEAQKQKKSVSMRVGEAMTVDEFERRYAERIARSRSKER